MKNPFYLTGDLNVSIPVYVTRKTAGGTTGQLYISVWVPIITMILFFLNTFFWGVIGLVQAVRYFV